ncbi:MAG: Uma2 family endonuclease [Chloroflexaceae bacterium]|nr:Uma2 family endonuclease [Chloroflexaceae bacterium]
MPHDTTTYISAEAYLALEERSETKHEYIDGTVVPMPGVSLQHALIVSNLVFCLRLALRLLSGYQVTASDIQVWIPARNSYVYPDVTVTAHPPIGMEQQRPFILLNPTLIVEVLSDTTAAYDRGDKFYAYQTIDSFREYLLVDQARVHLTHHWRDAAGTWHEAHYTDQAAVVHLVSIPVTLPLVEVYADVPVATEA